MAKKVNLEEDDFDKEIAEEVVEADDAEVIEPLDEDAEVIEPIDEDVVEPVDADEVEDVELADEDDGGDEPPAEKPVAKGKNSPLTLALCFLNVAAALGFVYLLILDYHKRQEWSYAVFLHELHAVGLPLKEEDAGPSGSRVTTPHQRLDSKQITDVFSLRGGKGSNEPFWAVDEPYPDLIQAKNLTPETLKDYFGSLGDPVASLEAEVSRLKDKVLADITRVGQEAAAASKDKADAAKRAFAASLLLPIAYDPRQVDKLDAKIKATSGATLDALILDAAQRRVLVDLLAPCEIFRPGDVTTYFFEKVADADQYKLDDLQNRLRQRFDVAIADKFDGAVHQGKEWNGQKRLSWEKRQTIGFLLVALASVQKTNPAQPDRMVPLYPEMGGAPGTPNLLRAQTVLGLYEFTAAVQNLPIAWYSLQRRVIHAIHVDREGFEVNVKDKGLDRNLAFIDKYSIEIRQIQDLVLEIKGAEHRLKDLQEQNKKAKGIYEYRSGYLDEMTKQLKTAREETGKQVAKLREIQQQIFQAQAVLRDASERNLRLDQEIKAEERKLRSQTGANTP